MFSAENITTIIFNLLAIISFIVFVYLIVSKRLSTSGVVTAAVMFVFCSLMGNPDRFQTMKFSLTGVETTARATIEQVQITLEKLQKMEVAFAKANLNQLALSGQLLFGIKTEDKFSIRNNIVSILEDAGVSKGDILDAQGIWINVYCSMILDHIEGALERSHPNLNLSKEIDALPVDQIRNIPSPESLRIFVFKKNLGNGEIINLLSEYTNVWTTGSMKNPSIIPFNENMRIHVPTSPEGYSSQDKFTTTVGYRRSCNKFHSRRVNPSSVSNITRCSRPASKRNVADWSNSGIPAPLHSIPNSRFRNSTKIPVLTTPFQGRAVGPTALIVRLRELPSVQFVILPSVLKFLPDPAADLESKVRRDRHIAGVEQAVDVAAKQHAFRGFVFVAVRERPDMRGFERRQGPLARHGAPASLGGRLRSSTA